MANPLVEAHKSLRDELIEALQSYPSKEVRTPGFHLSHMPAADVILDDFSGKSGEQSLHALLWIAARASKGENVQEAAGLWLTLVAERFASFHELDLVQQQIDGGSVMSITTYGPGDPQTWGFCVGHPNDPRTEVDEDDGDEDREENDFDRRMRERDELDDWLASCAADQAAEDHFAGSNR